MSWNIGLKDKIGTLSHSAGIISLQPSLLTIGGRQYKTTAVLARTISADVTMTANSLYMIYAQVVSGVVVLRISASVRSSYKLINTQSELVGAFYANGLGSVAFGSFVNIYGNPETGLIPYAPVINAAFGTPTNVSFLWRRSASLADISGVFTTGTTTASEARVGLPSGLTSISDLPTLSKAGDMGNSVAEAASWQVNIEPSITYLTMGKQGPGSSGFAKGPGNSFISATAYSLVASVPILGWSATTQLMDL